MKSNRIILFFLIGFFNCYLYAQQKSTYKLLLCQKIIKNSSIKNIVFISEKHDTILLNNFRAENWVDINLMEEYTVYFFLKKRNVFSVILDSTKFEFYKIPLNILCIDFSYPQNITNATITLNGWARGITFYSKKVKYSSLKKIRKKFNF